jgi:predicted AlkP superfamily phosphohydrolase/phosphomutase
LDAADPALIERWTDDGSLPALKNLRERGAYGRLASPAEWMTGSTWPTFYTGRNPANHGFYNYLVWRAETMTTEPPAADWMTLRPFWRDLKEPAGPVVIAIDAPLTYGVEPFNGKEIVSLGTHDSLIPMSGYPPEFVHEIRSRFGEEMLSNERYTLQSKREFRETRDQVIQVAGRVCDLCVELIAKEPWDLFLASFASVHRAGHRLWALHNITDRLNDAERAELSDGLRQVYQAADRAVGRMLKAAGPDTTVLVFSLHGMGANSSKTILLPEMLRRVLTEDTGDRVRPSGWLQQARELIPASIRHHVKSRLPLHLRHRLTAFWRQYETDWSATRAFSMLSDMQGWIRINLKGRESRGIVEPAQFDDLCERIAVGLRSFVDVQTNEPIVSNIVRTGQVFEGEKLDRLPDLIVQWSATPSAGLQAIVSPLYGRIDWPTPGRNPEGRSGNHRSQGMLIAAGAGIKSGNIAGAHTLDLAPTMLALLGQPVPRSMEGKPLFKA